MPAISHILEIPDQSATSQVFRALYDSIITLKLSPGEKVSEVEIAKEFGLSRQPVRDAFYRLSALGLLSIRPQRATTISYISEQKLLNARFARTALEIECLRSLIQNPEKIDHKLFEQLLVDQAHAIKHENHLEFHALDDQFHKAIAFSADHAYAWQLIADQKAHTDRVCYLSLGASADLAFRDHVELFEHIKNLDLKKAERVLRRHLSNILADLSDIRHANSEYFDDNSL